MTKQELTQRLSIIQNQQIMMDNIKYQLIPYINEYMRHIGWTTPIYTFDIDNEEIITVTLISGRRVDVKICDLETFIDNQQNSYPQDKNRLKAFKQVEKEILCSSLH